METSESKWEYDAPQFCDFLSGNDHDDPHVDAWFDEKVAELQEDDDGTNNHFDHEIPENDDSVYVDADDDDATNTESEVTYSHNETSEYETTDTERKPVKRRRSTRIAGSSSVDAYNSERCGTPDAKRVKHEPGVVKKLSNLRTEPFPTTVNRQYQTGGNRGRRSTPAQQRRSAAHTRRSVTSSNTSRRSTDSKPANTHKKPPVMPMAKLTMPKTPGVLKRPAMKAALNLQTSEEMEIEKIKRLRKQAEETRKRAQKSLHQVHTSSGSVKPVFSQEPTRVKEFHFQTDLRIKNHPMETRQDKTAPKSDKPLCLTVPKPFHLHDSKKTEELAYKFKSDAEKMMAFQKNTPERFRSRARNKPPSPLTSRGPSKLTVAKTPNLGTRSRKRPVTVISKSQLEEKEVEEMKRYKFRANPINHNLFQNPNQGVQKVPTKEPTVPVGFDLGTDKRIQERAKPEIEDKYEFHAQPVPKKILQGTVGVPKPAEQRITVPQSPAFALKKRIKQTLETPVEKEEVDRVVKANPVPHPGISFQPKLEHKYTVPEPFSFERKDKQRYQAKEENIKKMIEEESKVPEFHAQPLPLASPELPQKHVKPATRFEPFQLASVERGAMKAEEWSRKVEEELKQQRAQAQFKAKPASVVQKEPFIPRRSNRALTEVSEFDLNTERRAVERKVHDEIKKDKQQEMDEIERERQELREQEEKEAVAKLREELVHKAKPIRQYKPVVIHPSDKPLTAAESPQFSDRFTRKTRV